MLLPHPNPLKMSKTLIFRGQEEFTTTKGANLKSDRLLRNEALKERVKKCSTNVVSLFYYFLFLAPCANFQDSSAPGKLFPLIAPTSTIVTRQMASVSVDWITSTPFPLVIRHPLIHHCHCLPKFHWISMACGSILTMMVVLLIRSNHHWPVRGPKIELDHPNKLSASKQPIDQPTPLSSLCLCYLSADSGLSLCLSHSFTFGP